MNYLSAIIGSFLLLALWYTVYPYLDEEDCMFTEEELKLIEEVFEELSSPETDEALVRSILVKVKEELSNC